MGAIPWHALMDFKFDALETYIEDWKSTNKEIKSTVGDVTDTVMPGVSDAFGGLDGTKFSKGGEAATKKVQALADDLEDARIEGKAVKRILVDAVEELRPIVKAFKALVDEINGTKGPLDTDNNYEVDIGGFIHPPSEPDLKDLDKVKDEIEAPAGGWDTSEGALSIWQGVVNGKIAKWEKELNQLAEDAGEVDDEASSLLNGASATATESFNGNAGEEVEQASVEEQEKDAEEVEDRLTDGEITEEDIEFANQKMKEHAGEEHFSYKLMDDLGPKGLAEMYGQAAIESPASDKEMEKFQKYLGVTLATATDPVDGKPNLGEEYVEEFKKQGVKEMEFETADGETVSASGYHVLGSILENGHYSEDFLVPVSEHLIQLDASGYGWHDLLTVDGQPAHLSEDGNPFNPRHEKNVNPLNSALLGLGRSPEASLELFTKDPELQEPTNEENGRENYVPDNYLDYFLDERINAGTTALGGGHTYPPDGNINGTALGAALESAATGMAYDNPTDPAVKHTEPMADFTRDLIAKVSKNPEDFAIDGKLHGTLDGISDVGANYMADIYQTYQSGYDPDVHTWIPKSWAEEGGELEMFSDKDEVTMNGFLDVLGGDPESALKVAVASEGVATASLENKFGSDDFDKYGDALTPHTKIVAEMNADGMKEIYKDYAAQDKSTNDTIDLVSRSLNSLITAGVTIENPFAGAVVKGVIGESITALAGELKVDSSDLAEMKADLKAVESSDALYSWGFDVAFQQMENEHPDWSEERLNSEAAAAADDLETKYASQLGLRK